MVFPVVGNGHREWGLTESKVAEYRESFPSLDVRAEALKARQYVRDNPTKRKTASGMAAYLGRWFTRATDRGGSPAVITPPPSRPQASGTPWHERLREVGPDSPPWVREIEDASRKQARLLCYSEDEQSRRLGLLVRWRKGEDVSP